MRCKYCGGPLTHFVTDLIGRTFWRCKRGLCHVYANKTNIKLSTFTEPCNRVYDDKGMPYSGFVTYVKGFDEKKHDKPIIRTERIEGGICK